MLVRLITALVALLLVVVPVAAAYSGEASEPGTNSAAEIDSGAVVERPGTEQPMPDSEQQGGSSLDDPTSPERPLAPPVVEDSLAPAPGAPVSAVTAPSSMAALGDSITKGFNACGFYFDCVARSWSTGDAPEVGSHYLGLRELNPAIEGKNFNEAKSGAVAADMAGQAQRAVAQRVEYVTLLVGANDACKPTEDQMTPVQTYSEQVRAALTAIKSGIPDAKVFIASIPDVKRVWETSRGSFAARSAWKLGNICQSMLANPTSDAPADNERRDRVRQRVVDYNTALAQLCAEYGGNCKFDGNAVFNRDFPAQLLSNFDFFHPNEKGQAELARITRAAGFQWSKSLDNVLA
jgi:lysophospholipase L1-like esterase